MENITEFLKSATMAERFAALRVGYATFSHEVITWEYALTFAERIAQEDGWAQVAPAWLEEVRRKSEGADPAHA